MTSTQQFKVETTVSPFIRTNTAEKCENSNYNRVCLHLKVNSIQLYSVQNGFISMTIMKHGSANAQIKSMHAIISVS